MHFLSAAAPPYYLDPSAYPGTLQGKGGIGLNDQGQCKLDQVFFHLALNLWKKVWEGNIRLTHAVPFLPRVLSCLLLLPLTFLRLQLFTPTYTFHTAIFQLDFPTLPLLNFALSYRGYPQFSFPTHHLPAHIFITA